MEWLDKFNYWKSDPVFDEATKAELSKLDPEKDAVEIEDRFYKDLEFGTGGLRGVMGAGTNRMNKYTVGKATKGLSDYLLDTFKDEAKSRGVVIAHDTRTGSAYFAQISADVLSAAGIKVYLIKDARPTPQLSFSVKHFGAAAGIVVTASHNPKEYNGYKAYDEFGCQLVPDKASVVIGYVEAVKDFADIPFEGNPALIENTDDTDDFVNAVLKESRLGDAGKKQSLKIVYTPIHGSGFVPVTEALKNDGFTDVNIVTEQKDPDGNFPTVNTPNPEDKKALELGIKMAGEIGADIVFGTDPDSDRIGAAVKDGSGYALISGNQMGALLTDFVVSHTDLSKLNNPAIVKTVVTSELGAEIAKKKGLSVFSTLTGFKFIGEKITQFEAAKNSGDKSRDYSFVFGYEESYGYLAGTHARDKDAVVSAMLICEMAAEYKAEGKTLLTRLNELYAEYGYYLDFLDSFTLKGKDGQEQISRMMEALRKAGAQFKGVLGLTDYSEGVPAEEGFGKLPASNVLKYVFNDGSWMAVRPSGTEPKIKIYYSVKAEDKESAQKRLEGIRGEIKGFLGL